MYEAIIVGGGIVGTATAYHLIRHGAKTLLIDRHDPGRATDAGAGILAPEASEKPSEEWFNFAVEAVAYYPALIEQLQTGQEEETGYATCGKLTVAISEDEDERFAAAKQLIFERQQRRGLPTADDLFSISAAEACRLFPALASPREAIYYRHGARVDGRLLTLAMRRAAEQQGLAIINASADQLAIKPAYLEGLILKKRAVTGVLVGGETIEARKTVIAGGAWSRAFSEQLGLDIPVIPQRGQIIHLTLPEVDTAGWPVVSAFHGHYIVPWPDGRIVVGATREAESGFEAHTTAAGIHEVLGEALRVAPGLADATLHEIRVGLRPYVMDGLPIIGSVPNIENIYLATGHGPTGLQLGPYSGKIVADLIAGHPVEVDLSAFSAARFHTNF